MGKAEGLRQNAESALGHKVHALRLRYCCHRIFKVNGKLYSLTVIRASASGWFERHWPIRRINIIGFAEGCRERIKCWVTNDILDKSFLVQI